MRLVEKKNFNFLFTLFAGLIFVVFLWTAFNGQDGLLHLWQLKKMRDSLLQKNHVLLLETLALRQELQSLKNSRAVLHRIRESLGFVYSDEVLYVPPPRAFKWWSLPSNR